MSNSTIRVVARIVSFPEKVEEAKALLLSLIEPSRQDNGCIKYELLQNRADPTIFTFVEEWVCDADLDAHLASSYVAAAIARIPELIAEGPDIQRYNLLA
jgi:quinol monooxygenase YgiN